MKIKKIKVINFQSHQKTEIELSDGLNIFVGETDQGKTSLAIRSLKWVFFNEPQGDDFVRILSNGKKAETCEVTVEMCDGTIVTRKREKHRNLYSVTDITGNVQNFENFGNNYPIQIIEKLKLDEDQNLNLNIVGAKDKGLIYESDSFKSKVIGSFAGAHIVDAAIRDLLQDQRDLNKDTKIIEDDIVSLEAQLNQFHLDNKETVLETLDNKEKEILNLKEKKNSLIKTNSQIKRLKQTIETDTYSLKNLSLNDNENIINKLQILKDKLQETNRQKEKIVSSKKKISDIKNEIKIFQDGLKNDSSKQKEETISKLEVLVKKANETKSKKDAILKLQTSICEKKSNQQKGKDFIKERDLEIRNLANQCGNLIKQTGKCPLCKGQIEEEHTQEFINELIGG